MNAPTTRSPTVPGSSRSATWPVGCSLRSPLPARSVCARLATPAASISTSPSPTSCSRSPNRSRPRCSATTRHDRVKPNSRARSRGTRSTRPPTGGTSASRRSNPTSGRPSAKPSSDPIFVELHGTADESTRLALYEELIAIFAERTYEAWEDLFAETDATVEPVRTLGEALSHPQTASRGLLEHETGPARIGFPALSSDHAEPGAGVPGHGEHTASVLREVGYGRRPRPSP